MPRLLVCAACLGIAATPAAASPPILGGAEDSATITASPAFAAARPSALTLRLHYEMLCAQPGRGPVTVTFPQAVRLPPAISAAAVLVADKPAPAVRVDGRVVTIGLAPIPKVICQSFVPGTLKLRLTRAARIGNPVHAGRYLVRARVGSHAFAARLAIRP